jgi:hypothetical protein
VLLICDIDGSIADWRERAKVAGVEPDRTDLGKFQEWLNKLQSNETLLKDKPIPQTQFLVQKAAANFEIIYLTGRSELFRDATTRWLFENRFPAGKLIMRSATDYSTAGNYKEEHVKSLSSQYPLILVLDDDIDGDCSERYRRYGAVHLKVLV